MTPNDAGDGDSGPNDLLNFPNLDYATGNTSRLTIGGRIDGRAGTTVRVEFFANPGCNISGYGEGTVFLGAAVVTQQVTGTQKSFVAVLPVSAPVGQFVTATATDEDSNTSEFSACVGVQADADGDGISDAVENAGPNNGDGNRDGIPDSLQPNVTSHPDINGDYATFVSPQGTTLAGVRAVTNPSPGNAPPGVEFPVGFFDFMIEGMTPESRIVLLLMLHGGGLYSNQLSGPIPPALGNLGKLRELNLGSNTFEGSIPAELGRLANLTSLGLGYNRLSGNIPSDLTRLSRLWSLTLSGNNLEGQIPTGLANLTQLGWLSLDRNALTGGIPDGISNLTQLRFLGLSRNRLEGTVPAGLGNLTNLTNLYLGRNAGLTGPLPQDLVAARNMYQFTYDNTNLCMPNNDEFRSWLQGVKGRGGVTTNWQICGIEPHLSFSTPNALAGDVVLLHARLVDDELGRIRGSNQVSATVTGVEGSLQLGDNGTDGDLLGLDGHYSRWLTVMGADTIQAILHYKGWPVISTTVSLIADPQLIALTDLRRLDGEFTKWGTVPGEDLDGNDAADFYDLLDRAWRYAEKYRGIVYDLGHTITRERGFMDDYDLLDPSPDAAESRMGWLIRDLMDQLYLVTGESIEYLAIAGSRPVVPMCVVDMGGEGDKHDFRRSDLVYAMHSYSTPQQEQRPAPDVPYGRISAEHPNSLATLFDIYEQPLVTDPQANAVTLYRECDSAFHVWEDWKPWLTPRFSSGDIAAAPPYAAGHYYYYDGAVVIWRDVDVLQGLSGAAWTVINSHATATYNSTEESSRSSGAGLPSPLLESIDYAFIPLQPGHLYINAGCNAGFPPAAGSDKPYISQAVMDRHITYVGNSWNGREYDDTLWVAFADQLTLGSTPTVGAALVGAYGPYWARYAASDRKATEQAYTKALYGLPTQPLQHAAGGQAAVVATSPLPVALQGSPPTATTRELSLAVDVPQFAYEHSAAGTVVRPANGGTVLEEEGQPILPPRPAVAGLPTEPAVAGLPTEPPPSRWRHGRHRHRSRLPTHHRERRPRGSADRGDARALRRGRGLRAVAHVGCATALAGENVTAPLGPVSLACLPWPVSLGFGPTVPALAMSPPRSGRSPTVPALAWNEVARSGDRPQRAGEAGQMPAAASARIAAAASNPGDPGTWSCRLPCRSPSEPAPAASSAQGAAADPYPAASFRANVVPREDSWVLYLSAIPASYVEDPRQGTVEDPRQGADHQLTLFHHMSFRIRYDLAAPVAVTLTGVTVNEGRPVSIGQANVPLSVGITTGQATSLTVAYEVADPGGFTLTDQEALVDLPAGAHQVAMTLDTRGWGPGPKLLNARVAGPDGVYDTRAVAIIPQGLRLALQAAPRQLPGLAWSLSAAVRDETGAAVSGLAGRFTLTLDGTPASVTFVEGPSGSYRASVPASALPEGMHRAVVTVRDAGGRVASDEAWVAVEVFSRSYLPLALRRGR